MSNGNRTKSNTNNRFRAQNLRALSQPALISSNYDNTTNTDNTIINNNDNDNTVGFHNFSLRIFNLRVSNPNKLIVDVPGSRPKKTR